MNDRKILLTSLKIVGIVIAALTGVYLLVELRNILVCVIFSLTLAAAIAPVAEWGEQRKISRITMVLLVYLFVGLIYSLVAFSLFPAAKAQWNHLYEHLPNYLTGVTNWFENVKGGLPGESGQAIRVEELIHNIAIKLGHQTLDVGAGLLVLLLDGLLVLFLTAYFVVEATAIWAKLLMWLPHEHRVKAASLIRPLGFRMGGYVRGQLLVSVAVAVYLTAGLTLLNVNYALILGVLAGLLNLVPFVGSLIACIFAVVVAANQSIWLAGATLALFAFEQWCESNFFVPYLLGRNVELHPLIVLIAILIGATLMGVPGALIAVPLASAAQFLAQEFYLKPLNDGRAEPLIVGGKLITPVDETEMPEKQLARVELPPVIFSASVEGSCDSVEPAVSVVKPVSNVEDMTPVPELSSKEREPT